ncbi:PspC domain-containing protein [Kineococcus sp. SYSU DK006]|uniref:PspC domain-containing protein n=1 Tax=Kineococcus sp. SYSU DK006 TaxID=3383127 RepID=UPI003D7DB1B3
MNTLSRPVRGKVVAGVCAGLARRFGLSPTVVRLLFVLSCVLPGPQVLVYAALWVVVPKDAGR